MDYKYGVGIGALAGLALDGAQRIKAYAKYGQIISDQIDIDRQTLGQTRTLPPLEPPPSPLDRRPRNLLLVTALAALATGAVFGILSAFAAAIFSLVSGELVGVSLLSGVFFGMIMAVVTTAFPGVFVALVMQRREAVKKYAFEGHKILMDFHQHREMLRVEVNEGRLAPLDAAQQLAALVQD